MYSARKRCSLGSDRHSGWIGFFSRLAVSPPGRAARALLRRWLAGRLAVVRVLGGVARGVRMELDLGREKSYWLGSYEPDVQRALARHVGPRAVVYDVGAHVGFFSVCAGRLGAAVYAFEPYGANARRIRRNAELNAFPIEVVEAAVWERDEEVALIAGDSASEGQVAAGAGVAGVRLDSFVVSHEVPTFVKIDAEGAEAMVLRGATSLLRTAHPVLVCEVHGRGPKEEVLALLEQVGGYAVSELGSTWRLLAEPDRDLS